MPRKMPSAQIICICGSVRFKKEMLEVARYLELDRGRIVVMPNVYSKIDCVELEESELNLLVSVHEQKIKMADEIYVVDALDSEGQPYVGESTQREVKLALKEGKTIEYLSRDERFRESHESFQKRMKNKPIC